MRDRPEISRACERSSRGEHQIGLSRVKRARL
jgi:hypothetical protein